MSANAPYKFIVTALFFSVGSTLCLRFTDDIELSILVGLAALTIAVLSVAVAIVTKK